jgi:hypothetical protein
MKGFIHQKKGKIFVAWIAIFLLVFWEEVFHLAIERRLR